MNNVVPGVLGKVSGGIHQLTVRAVQQGDPASPVVLVLPAMGGACELLQAVRATSV